MHNTDVQYIRSNIHQIFTSYMHNLKTNFDKFFNITKSVFKDRLNESDNFFSYSNKPKLSDCVIIALSVTGESIGISKHLRFHFYTKSVGRRTVFQMDETHLKIKSFDEDDRCCKNPQVLCNHRKLSQTHFRHYLLSITSI